MNPWEMTDEQRKAYFEKERLYKEELRRRARLGDWEARDVVGGYDEWYDEFDED